MTAPAAAETIDLRAERLRRGLSVVDVAERLQVHPTSVLRYERRDRSPSGTTVLALAELLELRAYDVSRFFDQARGRADVAADRGVRGVALRSVRRRRGVSARLIAARLGLHVATVYNWEHGRARVPREVIPELAVVLRVPPDDLVEVLQASPRPGGTSRELHPLRRLRRRAGLSQRSVASRIGCSSHSLGRWEQGEPPPLHAVRLLARLYGTSVAHLAALAGVEAPAELVVGDWRPGDLPRVLRALRAWSGRSQLDVARLCGCSVAAVRAWESGRSAPGTALRVALEDLHRLSRGALLQAYPGHPVAPTQDGKESRRL